MIFFYIITMYIYFDNSDWKANVFIWGFSLNHDSNSKYQNIALSITFNRAFTTAILQHTYIGLITNLSWFINTG